MTAHIGKLLGVACTLYLGTSGAGECPRLEFAELKDGKDVVAMQKTYCDYVFQQLLNLNSAKKMNNLASRAPSASLRNDTLDEAKQHLRIAQLCGEELGRIQAIFASKKIGFEQLDGDCRSLAKSILEK